MHRGSYYESVLALEMKNKIPSLSSSTVQCRVQSTGPSTHPCVTPRSISVHLLKPVLGLVLCHLLVLLVICHK